MRRFVRALTGGKRVNRKAVLILAGITLALGPSVYGLHRLQTARNAGGLLEEADRAERADRPEQAANYLEQYLGLEPGDTDTLARYGLLLSRLAQDNRARGRALLTLNRALMHNANRPEVRRAAAKLATGLGHFRQAKDDLDQLLKAAAGPDAELLHLYGRCERGLHEYDKAADWYGKAAAAAPGQVEISLEYAALLRERLQRPEDADAAVEEMTRRDGRSPRVRLEAARYFVHYGQTDEAWKHVRFALDELGPSADLLLQAAEVAAARGQTKQAREFLERGRRLYPQDERMAPGLALLELRQGAPAKALAELAPSLAALPKDPHQLWTLGNLLVDAGAADRAGEILGRLRAGPLTPLADVLAARLAMRKGAWAEALAALEKARGVLPVASDLAGQVNLLLAECHGRLGNPEQQLQAARTELTRRPASVPARRMVAVVLAQLGKVEEAILEYRTLANQVPEVRADLARLLLARNRQQPPAARAWTEFDRLLEKMPADGDTQLLRAAALAARGQADVALRAMEAECKRDPRQVAPWLFRVRLARQQGQEAAAMALLDQAERQAGPRVEWLLARAEHWYEAPPEQARRELAKLEAAGKPLQGGDRDRLLRGLGEMYVQVGDNAAAVRLWRELAARQPTDLPVRFRLLQLAYDEAQEADVERLFGEIRKIDGAGGAMTAYAEAARLLLQGRRGERAAVAAALRALNRATVARPRWAAVARLQAEAHELDGQADKALESYQAALDRGDSRMGTVRRLLKLLLEQKRHAEAQAVLGKLSRTLMARTGLARLDAQLALVTAEAGDGQTLEEVRRHRLKAARDLVAADSKDYRDYLWLGLVSELAGERAAAEKALRKARELAREAPETWATLILLLAQTDRQKAEEELAAARKELPPARQASVLAAGYEALGQLDKAGRHYAALAEADSAGHPEMLAAAAFYDRTGQWTKSEPLLRRLLDPAVKAPAATAAWARRALAVTLAAGTYPQFKEALALVPERPTEESADRQARAMVLATRPAHRREAIGLLEGLPAPSPGARFVLARLYQKDGRWPRARVQLLGLLAEDGNNPAYLDYMIRGLLHNKEAAEAQPYMDRLAKLIEPTFAVTDLRARVLHANGQKEEARRLVQQFAGGAGARLDRAARLLEDLDHPAEAEKLYRAHAADAKQPENVLELALYLGRHKRLAEALDICAVAWTRCRPEAVANASVTVVRAGGATAAQAQQVESWLKAALRRAPQAQGVAMLLAELYEQQGEWDRAMAVYRDVLRPNGRSIVALNNLAYLQALRGGDVDEALRLADRAIELAGPLDELLDTRALVHLKKGQAVQAVKDLQQAMAQARRPVQYFHLAQAQRQAGNRVAAAEAWRQVTRARLSAEAVHALERPAFLQLTEELK
jgi:tetratricopeptide (TPR) repeat protein